MERARVTVSFKTDNLTISVDVNEADVPNVSVLDIAAAIINSVDPDEEGEPHSHWCSQIIWPDGTTEGGPDA